jgi:hypothetical protein
MTNTVCVLTNFRAGSTSFTLLKSEEYNLPYKGELFSHERPWDYAGHLSFGQEANLARTEPDNPRIKEFVPGRDFFGDYTRGMKNGEPICFKLMPDHIVRTWELLEDPTLDERDVDVVRSCDKVYILYRRDFEAQALSWIGMRCDGKFGVNGFTQNPRHGNPTGVEYHKRMHLGTEYGATQIRKIKGDMHGTFVDQIIGQLINNYKRMAYIQSVVPNIEVVCMEDYFSELPYLKYNHEYVWEDGKPEIPEFDVEGLFV